MPALTLKNVSSSEIYGTGANGQNQILLCLGRYEHRIVRGEDFSLAEDESDES
jgi:hypothetical protein